MQIIVAGLPGTGKTTISKQVAKELNAEILRTDEIRKNNEFSEKEKKTVYEKMLSIAEKELKKNKNIILDATFYKKKFRSKAKKIAERNKTENYLIEVTCSEKALKKRINKRFKEKKSKSKANYEVYLKIKKQFQKINEKHFQIDSSENYEHQVREVLNSIKVNEFEKNILPKIMDSKTKVIETHISWVLIKEKTVLKIKKPVKFEFLDYSSLQKRKFFCEKEIEINSEFSPEIYLGIIPIRIKGKIIDYAVKMKKLNEKKLLNNLIKKNKIKESHLNEIAKKIAEFHGKAKTCKKYSNINALKSNLEEIFLIEDKVERLGLEKEFNKIKKRMNSFFEKNKPLFNERINEGKIRHCHGDLRAKNIFIENERPIIFDAVEFNERISCMDTLNEIAYLAMDLDFFRKENLSEFFVKKYLFYAKEKNLLNLIDFYKCFKAIVAALTLLFPQKKQKETEAKKYIILALKYSSLL